MRQKRGPLESTHWGAGNWQMGEMNEMPWRCLEERKDAWKTAQKTVK